MVRQIDDKDYMECLPSPLYLAHYELWRKRMLPRVDDIAKALRTKPLEEVMIEFTLTPRDVALLVQLRYLTGEEVEEFNLGSYAQVTVI